MFVLGKVFSHYPRVRYRNASLCFCLGPFQPVGDLRYVVGGRIVAPMATLLSVHRVILFAFSFRVYSFSSSHDGNVSVFFGLACSPCSHRVFRFYFRLFSQSVFALRFLRSAKGTFCSSASLFGKEVAVVFIVLFCRVFGLSYRFFSDRLMETRGASPWLCFRITHSLSSTTDLFLILIATTCVFCCGVYFRGGKVICRFFVGGV